MELVKGVPITKFCDERKLTPRERLELFLPVCHAIQHAHQKGIIHRDIKPNNVLVALYDGRPVPKVIDFGVAKAAGQPLTEKTLVTGLGAVVGTPEYMSPEQAELNQLDIDTRSDIYSLGVLLYELLTGTTPVTRKRLKEAALLEVLRVIREEEPPKPSTRLSTTDELPSIAANRGTEPARLSRLVKGELDWVVMKALEKDRNRRYETADGFAADLQRYLAGEAVLAVPPSAGYRLRKFVGRNRGPVIATALVALALVAGIVGTTWGLIRADAARRDADRARQAESERADGERRAKQEAQANEADMQALFKFVEERVLDAAGPEGLDGGLGHDVTLRRAIEAALPFAARDFQNQPTVEARLRLTFGFLFLDWGEPEKAVEQFAASRAVNTGHVGPKHEWTLLSVNGLGRSYAALGRDAEAVALWEEAIPLLIEKKGPDHDWTLASMHNLAGSYAALERHADALRLREEVFARQKAKHGLDNVETMMALNNLVISYVTARRYDEALRLGRESLEWRKTKFGPTAVPTLRTMATLAAVSFALGRHADALKLREETLALRKEKLPPGHPEILESMENLASSHAALDRHADALKLLEEALALRQAKQGPNHPVTQSSTIQLAWVLATAPDPKLRNPARAVELAKRPADLSPKKADFQSTLGVARYRTGDWKGAIAELERAIGLRKVDDPGRASDGFFLAMAHWQNGERERAGEWFTKARAWAEEKKVDAETRRFRAEAAELLGVNEK
jgi:tetratricopeptide (TPR) repeat protein